MNNTNGRTWLHVSVSKPSPKKMPTYDDLQTARKLFIGDRECYQVFPRFEGEMPAVINGQAGMVVTL